jgi:hypothetical protein
MVKIAKDVQKAIIKAEKKARKEVISAPKRKRKVKAEGEVVTKYVAQRWVDDDLTKQGCVFWDGHFYWGVRIADGKDVSPVIFVKWTQEEFDKRNTKPKSVKEDGLDKGNNKRGRPEKATGSRLGRKSPKKGTKTHNRRQKQKSVSV